MNANLNIPVLNEVNIEKVEEFGERTVLNYSLPRKPHKCPQCSEMTVTVHDYRLQKITHSNSFERPTILFYKRCRYVCECGKRFSEEAPFVARYKRYTKEKI